jgi:two-component system NtrC family sensor kinase
LFGKRAKVTRTSNVRSAGTKAGKRVSSGRTSVAQLKEQLEARNRELAEAREHLAESLQQQTATADVLKVISRSTFDLETVLDTLVASACRLCEGEAASMWRPEGDVFKLAAAFGQSAGHREEMQQLAIRPGRETCAGRVLLDRQTVHIPDCEADAEYDVRNVMNVAGNRAMLGVPLLREDVPIGVLVVTRPIARPFTDKQIELATTFADQAVIAIENVRLFDEVQARTRELSEALEQQTAISAILRVMSNSRSDVKPVLDSVAEHAAHICEAHVVDIMVVEDGKLRLGGAFGDLGRLFIGETVPLDRTTVTGRSICDMRPVHVADLQDAGDEYPLGQRLAVKYGHRTTLCVPLIREGRALGTILVRRTEVRPFEGKDIALLTTFADQAAIAIENVRLFNEVQKRTTDLARSVEELQALGGSPPPRPHQRGPGPLEDRGGQARTQL